MSQGDPGEPGLNGEGGPPGAPVSNAFHNCWL